MFKMLAPMKALLLAAAVLAAPAQAQDSWTGHDKQLHFVVSGALGVASGAYFDNKWTAFGVAMIPGIAKEVIDSRTPGNKASGKDLAWDAIGAGLGVQLGAWGKKKQAPARSWSQLQRIDDPARWGIKYKRGVTMVTYSVEIEL